MDRPAPWTRLTRRARREWEGFLHARADRAQIAEIPRLLGAAERLALIARLQGARETDRPGLVLPATPSERLAAWIELHPGWKAQIADESAGPLRGEIAAFGRVYRIDDPASWCRDPLRPRPWPLRPHARILLNDPRTPGDVRMQWEPARFHHAPALARYGLASGDPAALDAFLRQTSCFERGNPGYDSIHWAVGMEVGIRATAWVLALDFIRCVSALPENEAERLLDALLLHGAFLASHPDRHPDGLTTNHTVAAAAGLAVVGRCLDASETGRKWREMGATRLAECLHTQVLAGGAHAEGALPYERFVLEAALVGFLCLDAIEQGPLRGPLEMLARHLAGARLPDGLPFIGDGDDSFFPPFGLAPFDGRNPLDPEAVLQVAEAVLGLQGLRRRSATEEAAFWLGAEPRADVVADPARSDLPGARASRRGFVRFRVGPFEGRLIARGTGEGWVATHSHNDLLSLVLTVDGTPVLIDPGTHGYAVDRPLRHRLRSTAAHSTLQFEDQEQSPIRPHLLFHGPAAIPCGARVGAGAGLRLAAWHDGFTEDRTGATLRHTRVLRWMRDTLWISDTLRDPSRDGDGAGGPEASLAPNGRPGATKEPRERVRSTLRFRFAPGLTPVLDEDPEGRTSRRRVCRVSIPGGTLVIFLLRPLVTNWRIVPGVTSGRYARRSEAAILEGTAEEPLAHRWRVALRFVPAA